MYSMGEKKALEVAKEELERAGRISPSRAIEYLGFIMEKCDRR